MVYLDYNATTPLAPEALAAMRPYLEAGYGNPSSIHAAGRHTRAALDDARDRMAALFGVKHHEVIFTSGGTEANNLAVLGLASAHQHKGRHLITSVIEHHAVLHAFEYLQDKAGFEVTFLPVDRVGRVDPEQFAQALRPDTILVSIMSANNETGVGQPIADLASMCRERGVLFHTDFVQSFGKEACPRLESGVDAIAVAAHKFYGPKGVGALVLRAGISLAPLHFGGAHENQRRPGTENVAAIVGMAAAAEWVVRDWEAEQERQKRLRDALWERIHAAYPWAIWNGGTTSGLANTLNVSFPGCDGEALLIGLDLEGVCVSNGSACMVGSVLPSHVLIAMGIAPEVARAAIRFSLGKDTSAEDVQSTFEALEKVLSRYEHSRAAA